MRAESCSRRSRRRTPPLNQRVWYVYSKQPCSMVGSGLALLATGRSLDVEARWSRHLPQLQLHRHRCILCSLNDTCARMHRCCGWEFRRIETLSSVSITSRMYNIASSALWLRIIAVVYGLAAAVAIGMQIASLASGFTIGISIATLAYAILALLFVGVGGHLRCIMAQNMASDSAGAQRTRRTVSVLQMLAGAGCGCFTAMAILTVFAQASGRSSLPFLLGGRVALACVAAVVTYAVGVTSTTPDAALALPSTSDALRHGKRGAASTLISASAGHRAPGIGRSAVVVPVLPPMSDADVSLVDPVEPHDDSGVFVAPGDSGIAAASRSHPVAPLIPPQLVIAGAQGFPAVGSLSPQQGLPSGASARDGTPCSLSSNSTLAGASQAGLRRLPGPYASASISSAHSQSPLAADVAASHPAAAAARGTPNRPAGTVSALQSAPAPAQPRTSALRVHTGSWNVSNPHEVPGTGRVVIVRSAESRAEERDSREPAAPAGTAASREAGRAAHSQAPQFAMLQPQAGVANSAHGASSNDSNHSPRPSMAQGDCRAVLSRDSRAVPAPSARSAHIADGDSPSNLDLVTAHTLLQHAAPSKPAASSWEAHMLALPESVSLHTAVRSTSSVPPGLTADAPTP